MNKVWVIARREFLATVRTRAFLLVLVLVPVMMGLGAVVGFISRRIDDQGEKTFAVIDRTPGEKVLPLLEALVEQRNKDDLSDPKAKQRSGPRFKLVRAEPEADFDRQRLALSDRVRKGEIGGFLEIGPDALIRKKGGLRGGPPGERAETRYQAIPNAPGSMEFYRWAATEVTLITYLREGAKDEDLRKMFTEQKPSVRLLGLTAVDPETGRITDDEGASRALARIFVGLGCVMLMFVIIFTVSTPMMQGVLEEKMQRISEVLLGSVSPFTLMAGKLLGGVGVALVLATVYIGGAYAGLYSYNLSEQVPPWLIGWFLFYMLLALLMYGSLFMAVGAACTDMKEPQTLMLPVMMPAMLPMFLLAPIMTSPDGVVARVASFFPPCTPMLMVARLALSANVAWWEPLVGSALVLGFTVFCVWMAGRIFRVGILVQGKGATFAQLAAWVLRG